ncbi:NAD-dependent epimerase/dehydratase family protein [Salinibacterium hongtaonis]|uniref:NAD-dependent epimerase/dehydratase family protein n=1 Tax=Homoserinimonas hongtaonis TaxID=2079791 RepID=UPI0022B91EB7|nr:NAD-dependent epimerase/dehydratase family protein [Salinibacterium hongtaonis]
MTGVAGFIGSTAAEKLLDLGNDVVGIDAITDYYDQSIKRRNLSALDRDGFTFIEGDLNELPLAEIVGSVDAVVHLAGQPGVRSSWGADFGIYTRANVDATQRLLEAAKLGGNLRRFVYASSSSIYGQADVYPTDETMVPRPFSPYGVTKLAGEHLTSLYRENFGVPSVSFRFFTVYGPRQRPDMAFSRFLTAAEAGSPITVYGDGKQIRDFTFVDDIVAALIASIQTSGELPPVMNLAGGSSVSVLEVLDTISSVTGRELKLDFQPAVDGDVVKTGGSSVLARSSLSWSPTVDVASGIARQYAWMSAL